MKESKYLRAIRLKFEKRNREIWQLRKVSQLSCSEIGVKYGLSSERIRQIIYLVEYREKKRNKKGTSSIKKPRN